MASIVSRTANRLRFARKGCDACGSIDGYRLHLHDNCDALYTLIASTSVVLAPETAEEMLSRMLRDGLISGYRLDSARLTVVLTSSLPGWTPELPAESLCTLASSLLRCGAMPACWQCGRATHEDFESRGDAPRVLCTDCLAGMPRDFVSLAGDRQELSAKIKYGKGTLGALAGAAIGSVVWLMAELFFDFPVIAGVAVSFLAGRGFMLASRRVDRKSAWIAWAVGMPALLVAILLSRDWIIDSQLIKDILFGLLFYVLGALDFVNVLNENGIRFWKRI